MPEDEDTKSWAQRNAAWLGVLGAVLAALIAVAGSAFVGNGSDSSDATTTTASVQAPQDKALDGGAGSDAAAGPSAEADSVSITDIAATTDRAEVDGVWSGSAGQIYLLLLDGDQVVSADDAEVADDGTWHATLMARPPPMPQPVRIRAVAALVPDKCRPGSGACPATAGVVGIGGCVHLEDGPSALDEDCIDRYALASDTSTQP